MSGDDYVPTRPLSVSIPKQPASHGPHCPRRPYLREILSNTSPAPWTLTAFMAYLSNNHCLETLEFTMDAGRYRKHYSKMMSRAGASGSPPAKDREYVWQLWSRLIDAYIQPEGSREVNLPSEVRDPILSIPNTSMPPAPEMLDPAVAKIYELMEESVLGPFLNSVYPQTAHPTVASCPLTSSNEHLPLNTLPRNYKDGSRRRQRNSSPPPHTAIEPHAYSYNPPSFLSRGSAPSALTAGLARAKVTGHRFSATSSAPGTVNEGNSDLSAANGPGMTDDTGSVSSPSGESPLTPPINSSDLDLISPFGQSPRTNRDSGMWKKLGRSIGVGRKKSQSRLDEER